MLRSSKKRVIILGSGIDLVRVERFERWTRYSDLALGKVFHPLEVARFSELILENKVKALQFLASRFAVKEAFYKALCDMRKYSTSAQQPLFFLELARQIHIVSVKGVPVLPREVLLKYMETDGVESSVSISHESCCVAATVTIVVSI